MMRHLNADEARDLAGVGDVGALHEGPDGRLYEWVEGLSAWGEPIGYWQGLSDVPVEAHAPMHGLGALYQASDGALYSLHGVGDDEAAEAEDSAPAEESASETAGPRMGAGRPGEIRVGPDGRRYRWVMGMGPGGRRTGFWRRLRPRPPQRRGPSPAHGRPPAARARSGRARPPAGGGRKRKPFLKRLLPLAKVAASLIPVPGAGAAVRAGLTLADKALTRKGVSEYDGLGALYQAPDGSLYAVHGIDERALQDVDAADGAEGYAAADLDGFAADELDGTNGESEMGAADEADAAGVGGAESLEGYIRAADPRTLDAYVPERPPETRMFEPTREPPDHWKPLW